MAFFQGHDRFLHVALPRAHAAEDLQLALLHQRIDALHLHAEELFDRFLDFGLGRRERDLEHHLIVLGGGGRLLGDRRRKNHIVVARVLGGGLAHLKRASNASTAAFVSPSFSNCAMSALVFASFIFRSSTTMRSSLFAFAESACLSASARTFFGRPISWLRTCGPKARPPPRNCGTRAEPWRALPVPFCAYIFLPVRQISARFFTLWVPARRLASCQTMQR